VNRARPDTKTHTTRHYAPRTGSNRPTRHSPDKTPPNGGPGPTNTAKPSPNEVVGQAGDNPASLSYSSPGSLSRNAYDSAATPVTL
jgi:hypothetical protein